MVHRKVDITDNIDSKPSWVGAFPSGAWSSCVELHAFDPCNVKPFPSYHDPYSQHKGRDDQIFQEYM